MALGRGFLCDMKLFRLFYRLGGDRTDAGYWVTQLLPRKMRPYYIAERRSSQRYESWPANTSSPLNQQRFPNTRRISKCLKAYMPLPGECAVVHSYSCRWRFFPLWT
jgi:hypothetical protein